MWLITPSVALRVESLRKVAPLRIMVDGDTQEYLDQYRGQKVSVIVAPLGKAERKLRICGICGCVLNEVGECPRCKLAVASDVEDLCYRQREREQLFDDIERFLDRQ